MSRNRRCSWIGVAAAAAMLAGGIAPAEGSIIEYTLKDATSIVKIDATGGGGMHYWELGGKDHLETQWFWYRTAGMQQEEPIHTLTLDEAHSGTSDTNFDGDDETAVIVYTSSSPAFTIDLTFVLSCPTGNQAGILESIIITNNSGGELEMEFFQYADFNLDGTLDDTEVEITVNTAVQQDGPIIMSETVDTPGPDRTEVGLYSVTVDKLNDSFADNLDNSTGPIYDGNLTWAFQWHVVLPDGEAFTISKPKRLEIPEPGAACLIALGFVAILARRKRLRTA